MSVYQEKGGYTPIALELGNEAKKVLDSIIDKYQKQGMTTEEITYVIFSEVQMTCLMNQITKRMDLDRPEGVPQCPSVWLRESWRGEAVTQAFCFFSSIRKEVVWFFEKRTKKD